MDLLSPIHGIRDPVHSWIEYSDTEMDLIDSPLVQRLRWVSQLTGAQQVFPGGTNTRFIHSLGVMHLSGKYFDGIIANSPEFKRVIIQATPGIKCRPLSRSCEDIPVNEVTLSNNPLGYWKTCARLAGLLHDIGHGPFSHAFDATIYQQIYGIPDGGHDCHRAIIVKSDLIKPYLEKCRITPEDLISIWSAKSDPYKSAPAFKRAIYDIIRLIVQGPLGADRMDFTLRDSYFTGTTHFGTIASDRIIGNASIQLVNGQWRLHYHIKCLSDMINALDGRLHMYESVYFHKTVYAADILIHRMMESATIDLQLVERTLDIHKFVLLNDSTLIGEIASTMKDTPEIQKAKLYFEQLVTRKLPKLVKEYRLLESELAPAIILGPNEVLTKTRTLGGIDPHRFDKAGIYFYTGKHNQSSITCQEALDSIRYTPPQKPFYFLRVYRLQ